MQKLETFAPMPPSPAIVRVAGLPTSVLEPFSSSLCIQIEKISRINEELDKKRSCLADCLYSKISEASAATRRLLLQARRDCFNGRSLVRHWTGAEWREIRVKAGDLADAVVELERQLSLAREEFAAAWSLQLDHERRHLLGAVENRRLIRGIALASPVSVKNLQRLRAIPFARYGRKETRLQGTLLRYVTRAAFKLSPYSTLTRLGLTMVQDSVDLPLRLSGSGWEERSLLRLKRYLLDQLWDLLCRYPPFRDGLYVELNDTIEEVQPDRYRFLRPGAWEDNPEQQGFCYHLPSLVTASLKGPIVAWLLRHFPGQHLTWRELCRRLEKESSASTASCRNTADKLVRIGFLCLLPPWPVNAAHLESTILSYLRTLPSDPDLVHLIKVLDRLVALQVGYSNATEPASVVDELDGLIDEIWRAAAPLGGLEVGTKRSRLQTGNFYEDVFLRGPSSEGEVLQISRDTTVRFQRSLAPLVRFISLYNHRHDFLLTLGAFIAEHWPGRSEVGVLELFGATRALWQDYIKFIFSQRKSKDGTATFNPLQLATLNNLHRLRKEIWQNVSKCLDASPNGLSLDGDKLARLTTSIPAQWAPTVGVCLSIQPVDEGGNLWVLNRLYEGTGRYSSRYTSVMDEDMCSAYTSHLNARGWDDQGAQFLDLSCPQGDTLNIHAAQTQRLLRLPGQSLGLPTERCVSLRDLVIRWRGKHLPPELIDRKGLPCRPVHLGGAGHDFLPAPLKLLSLFGPGEMSLTLPPRPQHQKENVTISDRVTLDGVVLARKRWQVSPSPFPDSLESLSDEDAFVAINCWRIAKELPNRVFFIEHVHHEQRSDFYKPQYIDFTSTLMIALFRSALRQNTDSLTFEEMLPTPEVVPRDEQEHPWAIEVLLDFLALRAPHSDEALVSNLAAALDLKPLPFIDQELPGYNASLNNHGG